MFRYMADYRLGLPRPCAAHRARKQMSETVMLGGGGGRTNASTMILDGGQVEKPMLGRYQVEKSSARARWALFTSVATEDQSRRRDQDHGAVAGIRRDELADVRSAFPRGETAGRLNHPNIVTIFDAGEEHDLAFISMEFRRAGTSCLQTKPGALLPLPQVMSIVACVAEALAYAHRNNVVHRDVKAGQHHVRSRERPGRQVTDFGIARITDSSKTKTGMVLGTPATCRRNSWRARRSMAARSFRLVLPCTRCHAASCRFPASRWRS